MSLLLTSLHNKLQQSMLRLCSRSSSACMNLLDDSILFPHVFESVKTSISHNVFLTNLSAVLSIWMTQRPQYLVWQPYKVPYNLLNKSFDAFDRSTSAGKYHLLLESGTATEDYFAQKLLGTLTFNLFCASNNRKSCHKSKESIKSPHYTVEHSDDCFKKFKTVLR